MLNDQQIVMHVINRHMSVGGCRWETGVYTVNSFKFKCELNLKTGFYCDCVMDINEYTT